MRKSNFILSLFAVWGLALNGCNKNSVPLSPDESSRSAAALEKGEGLSSEQLLYAVTTSNLLLSFKANDPEEILSRRRITGLQSKELLLGIDFRPANGKLYGLGSTSRLYLINHKTGAATAVGAQAFEVPLYGTAFGFDFNPTVDRIRVVSNAGQNMRLHPDLGTVVDFDPNTTDVQTDQDLAFATPDVNAGRKARVIGSAYSNPDNDPGTSTALYNIDSNCDVLVTQDPPNDGVLNTVAPLRRNLKRLVGFDIAASNQAYVILGASDDENDHEFDLVTVNLETGKMRSLGEIEVKRRIIGLAASIE